MISPASVRYCVYCLIHVIYLVQRLPRYTRNDQGVKACSGITPYYRVRMAIDTGHLGPTAQVRA